MNEINTEYLVEKYPKLYAMRHYFECGDGWFELIDRLSAKLEKLIEKMPVEERTCYATQVKEKYGTLRFYMSCETDEMSDAIEVAERESAVTCELCGCEGMLQPGAWIRTLCGEHQRQVWQR